MSDELLVVQFPHPGGEHGADQGNIKEWNLGTHRRKFMRAPGRWRVSPKLDAPEQDGDVVFWGEWEPPSRIITELPQRGAGFPRFLHEPFWTTPPDRPNAQNTDPYVFGEHFLYSNCRQNTRIGPLRTQRLARGSLILFGSGLNGEFVLDTALVVADAQPVTAETFPDLRVLDEAFRTVTLDLLFPSVEDMSFRLYEGATPASPVEGMFSFFPGQPSEDPHEGFSRPAIVIDGIINPRNWRSVKMTPLGSVDSIRHVWEQVVDQVLDQDLTLGVHAATPPRMADTVDGSSSRRDDVAQGASASLIVP